MRVEGLEPPRLAAPEPKSGASTNFATPAYASPNSVSRPGKETTFRNLRQSASALPQSRHVSPVKRLKKRGSEEKMSIQLRANAADLTASLQRSRIGGITQGSSVVTNRGPKAVESLRVGDVVLCNAGQRHALCAITHRRLDLVRPIVVKAGTFGQGKPAMDTKLAPGQHIMLRGWRAKALFGGDAALVAAWRLADGSFVAEADPEALNLFELHFERDTIVTVNGLEISAGAEITKLVERVA